MTTQYWITGTSGDWATGADWLSGVSPKSTDDAVINNSNAVTVNGTAVANSLTLNNSEVVVSGTLTLGTSLTLESGTSQAELALNGGSFSAQSVVSANGEGVIGGYGTLNSAVSGYVLIYATGGGTLKVEGSLAGDSGYCFITSNATLELVNGTSQLVQFGGGTLKLDAPTAFTGQIQDIAIGDTIDLAGITASSATYSGTTLTINETNGQQLTYNNVSGSVAGDIVTVASDNNGGTLVYWAQPQPPTVTSISATTDNQAADLNAGHLVTITMTTSGPVTVTGTPTLQLNDNEVATYTTGSSSNTLTFTYKVQPGDNVADLEVTGINLPPGVSIEDQATNALLGSVASDLSIQIDTTPPAVTERLFSDTGSSSTDKITSNDELIGSGDPNAVVHFTMDGKLISATATANSSGIWTFTPSGLADGVHTIVASETDAAGNTGTASLTFTLDTTAPVPVITSEVLSSGKVTLTGTTAEANDAIAVYDGATLIGTTTTASNGTWSFTTAKVSNVVHTYTATATDVAGNVGHSSNEAILGSAKAATLVGTPGNDIIIGNGGNDTITGGLGADTLTGGSGLFIIQSRIPHQAATTR
jgi:Bacterial Ig-like domain/RTX calcium-binding nonapeptide repeat (4 copies)